MPFDASTATPVDDQGGFDPSTAREVKTIADRAAPVSGPSIGARVLHGVGDAGVGLIQLAAHAGQILDPIAEPSGFERKISDTVDSAAKRREASYQESRGPDPGTDWWRGAGEIVGSAPAALMGGAVGGASALARVGASVGGGAISGAMQPVIDESKNFLAEKLKQIGIGAVGGGVAGGTGEVLSQLASPLFTAAARRLSSEGVKLTPGQGAGLAAKAFEDKATSIPLMGDAIARAQRQSVQSFNRAAYNRALAPIGETYDGNAVGREGIEQVGRKIGAAYDRLLPNVQFVQDGQFIADMNNLRQLAAEMPSDKAHQFENILNNRLFQRLGPQGTMDGLTFKQVESELGRMASGFHSSQDMAERQLGDALTETVGSLRSNLERNNPMWSDQLAKNNAAWSQFVRLQGAASRRATSGGIFTPGDLLGAVKSADKSVRKGAFARGDAMMQDLAEDAQAVIGNKYPDSGTAGRLAVNALTLGAVAGEHNALLGMLAEHPVATAALAGTMVPYLIGSTGRNALAGMFRAGGRAIAPAAGLAGADSVAQP